MDVLTALGDAFVTKLNEEFLNAQPVQTQAGVIRLGLLQADPTIGTGVNILIHYNRSSKAETRHHGPALDIPGLNIPIYEIGGCEGQSTMWVRRFSVEMILFFPPEVQSRHDAMEYNNIILLRAERAILRTQLPGTDDFGETPIQAFLEKSWQEEAGGEGAFQWYVYISVAVLTERTL